MFYVTHLEITFYADPGQPDEVRRLDKAYRRAARAWVEGLPYDFDLERDDDAGTCPALSESGARFQPLPGWFEERESASQDQKRIVTAEQEQENADKGCEWFSAAYLALRAYYGKFSLPPVEVLLAALSEADDLGTPPSLLAWKNWVEAQATETPTAFFFSPDFPTYAYVMNPRGSLDHWEWDPDMALAIWFGRDRDAVGDDAAMIDGLLRPLLAAREAVGFTGGFTAPIELSYVQGEGGVRTEPLEELLSEGEPQCGEPEEWKEQVP